MARYIVIRRLWRSLLLISILATPTAAGAQVGGNARISALITDQFPALSLSLTVSDSSGQHIAGLSAGNFTIEEDGKVIAGAGVEELQAGTSQIFVINTNAGLRLKDPLGHSLFDHVRQALLDWWASPPASYFGADDLTLITADGPLATHSSLAAELAAELHSYQPNFASQETISDLLIQALTFATNPSKPAGISKHVILITPPGEPSAEASLEDIIALANQNGILIHPVQVSRQEDPEQPVAVDENLRQLAEATGGTFSLFDPQAGFSQLGQLLMAQRSLYRLTFQSRANNSGSHAIRVAVEGPGVAASSSEKHYNIDLQPADLTFIQPPASIIRLPQDSSDPLGSLSPTRQILKILITFPDGHPRELAFSRLEVDGETADFNRIPPFDQFEWDISTYQKPGSHTIQVSAQDRLGLQASSAKLPVYLEVPPPPGGLSALSPATRSLLIGFGVMILAIILGTGVISLARRRAAFQEPAWRARRKNPIRLERAGLREPTKKYSVEAFLVPASPDDQTIASIPLTGAELTLGSDASLCSVSIDDPSVSGMHARLIRKAGGEYLIRDQDSIAGTWVNYEPVPEEGLTLRHQDLIHLGRVAFRFRRENPPPPQKIHIRPAEDEPAILSESPPES